MKPQRSSWAQMAAARIIPTPEWIKKISDMHRLRVASSDGPGLAKGGTGVLYMDGK